MKQTPIRRLQHLPTSPQHLPRQRRRQLLHLPRRHAGELRVPAVERPAHAAHGRGDDVARLELAAGSVFHEPRGFDAEDAGEGDVRAVALSGEEFGAVEAERFDADENPAGRGLGRGALILSAWRYGTKGMVEDTSSIFRTSGPPAW